MEYKSLSKYLDTKLYEDNTIIEEGLADFFKNLNLFGKGKTPTNDQTKKAGLLSGFLGSFWAGFKGAGKSSEDPLMKKYRDICAAEAKDEEDRLKKEYTEEQNLEMEKLTAEYEHNKAQLDLASARRVQAFKSSQQRLKEMTERTKADASSGKALLYSKEQNAEIINMIRSTGKDLGMVEGNPLSRMTDLAILIGTDKDGNPRSLEEILEAAKTDKELQSRLDEYNGLAKKHGKVIEAGMSSTDFKEAVGKLQNAVVDKAQLEQQRTDAVNNKEIYEQKSNAVKTANSLKTAYNKAKEEFETAEKALTSIVGDKNGKNASPFAQGYNPEDGTVKELKPSEFVDAAGSLASDSKFIGKDGSFDSVKFKKHLSDLGIPEETINEMSDTDPFKPSAEKIKAALNKLSESDPDKIKEAANKTKKSIEASIATAKSTIKSKQAVLDKTINIDDPNLSEEDLKTKLNEMGLTDAPEQLALYKSMSKEEQEAHDPSTEAGKAMKTDIEKAVTAANDAIKENNNNIEANKKAAQEAHIRENDRSKNAIPNSIKDDVEDGESGLEPGEEYRVKDGKKEIGFYIEKDGKKEWVAKPGPKEKDKNEKYIAERDKHLMTLDISKLSGDSDSEIASIKDNGDDTFTITYSNGKTKKTSKDVAIAAKINQRSIARTKEAAMERRHNLAKNLQECIKDGKLDKDKFFEMFDSDDPAVKADLEAIQSIINGDVDAEKYFKGIDLDGDVTLSKINDLLKDNKDSLKDAIENAEDDAYKEREIDTDTSDDRYEDVEDNEAEDDEERESDEDETYTDESGEEKTRKKVLKNPAKEYKRKKRKNGKGMTKSYYNKDGDSISPDEYKARMERYKAAKRKDESVKYLNLRNYLFEKINK